MVDRFGTSLRVKEQHCVEPGEVPCDVCTETQLKAMKSCLVCFISNCQIHPEPHQRVAGLKKPLEDKLNMEMKKLPDGELERIQLYEVDVTLDPDTASPWLILSEDGKQVHDGDVVKELPDNP